MPTHLLRPQAAPSEQAGHHGGEDCAQSSSTERCDDRYPGCLWRLLWCYERAFKPDEAPIRGAISELVGDSQGALCSFKRVDKLKKYVEGLQEPYVLLAGSREIKQCMNVFGMLPPASSPVLTAVLQPNPKLAGRVSSWFAKSPHDCASAKVHVITDVASLRPLLAEVLPRLGMTTAESSPTLLPRTPMPFPRAAVAGTVLDEIGRTDGTDASLDFAAQAALIPRSLWEAVDSEDFPMWAAPPGPSHMQRAVLLGPPPGLANEGVGA
mmetsp:Transcript_28117/g.81447  ORF Transcript_28117/g.81447 Transcript_28117/m.81447 type:complete len:267 (+) Transcript_28117:111-911(+)